MNSQRPEIRVIISGGGTGGHIFPAIAIANELKIMNDKNKILFVGANGRMEMEKVPKAGYDIVGLNISGMKRSFSVSNFKIPFLLMNSLWKSRTLLRAFRPDVVVGVGGYASGPLLFTAGMMKIPSLIQEQNSYAGITNKILAKSANRICVAYEKMERYFPKEKIVFTGNPVRKDISSGVSKKNEALEHFGLDKNRKTILVIGGSLGARTINESIAAEWNSICEKGIQILWQTGKSFFPKAELLANSSSGLLKTHDFISRMDLAYAAADIIISRAGASTLSELAIVGKPVILVPSPNVAEDHQTKNAMALVEKNAAILVNDNEAMSKLATSIIELTEDGALANSLALEISRLAKPESDRLIAEEVYKLAMAGKK